MIEVGLRQLLAGGALRSVPPKQRNKERRRRFKDEMRVDEMSIV